MAFCSKARKQGEGGNVFVAGRLFKAGVSQARVWVSVVWEFLAFRGRIPGVPETLNALWISTWSVTCHSFRSSSVGIVPFVLVKAKSTDVCVNSGLKPRRSPPCLLLPCPGWLRDHVWRRESVHHLASWTARWSRAHTDLRWTWVWNTSSLYCTSLYIK